MGEKGERWRDLEVLKKRTIWGWRKGQSKKRGERENKISGGKWFLLEEFFVTPNPLILQKQSKFWWARSRNLLKVIKNIEFAQSASWKREESGKAE